jgi:hypothetical protein
MKVRKRISTLTMLLIFSLVFATTVDAQRSGRRDRNRPRYEQQHQNRQMNRRRAHQGGQVQGQQGAVGAPLDGGLLVLLAGAGIAYFAARKKKKNAQE